MGNVVVWLNLVGGGKGNKGYVGVVGRNKYVNSACVKQFLEQNTRRRSLAEHHGNTLFTKTVTVETTQGKGKRPSSEFFINHGPPAGSNLPPARPAALRP